MNYTIGKLLRDYRKANCLTLYSMAQLLELGVGKKQIDRRTYMSQMESGHSIPGPLKIGIISQVTGESPEMIIDIIVKEKTERYISKVEKSFAPYYKKANK